MIIVLAAILLLWIAAALVLAVAGAGRPDVERALASTEQLTTANRPAGLARALAA